SQSSQVKSSLPSAILSSTGKGGIVSTSANTPGKRSSPSTTLSQLPLLHTLALSLQYPIPINHPSTPTRQTITTHRTRSSKATTFFTPSHDKHTVRNFHSLELPSLSRPIMLSFPSTRALLALALTATSALAQGSSSSSECVSLKGSASCPSFQDAYVNPSNLSRAWPWFTAVSDVASFDQQFELYFTDPNRYHQTKFSRQLQCNSTAAQNTTLQWQRTILCGQFSQISYSASCNVRNRADPIMVCQDTCTQYAGTEDGLVSNPQICPPDSSLTVLQNTTRYFNLNKDYVDCTNWTTLVSTNNATCVEGIMNEGNCGWGPNVNNQLCEYCDPSGNKTIPSCCTDSKTNLSQCSLFGYPGAASVRPTTSIGTTMVSTTGTSSQPTSTGAAPTSNQGQQDNGKGKRYSGGQIAGIVIGCIIGALLLGLLLGLLCFRRKNKNGETDPTALGRQNDVEKTRMLNDSSSRGGGAGAAGLAGAGLGAAAAGAGRGSEKDGGWSSPFRDEKTGSPAFGEKEVTRPGSSALGSTLGGAGMGAAGGVTAAHAANAPHSNLASTQNVGGRFSPSSGSNSGAAAGAAAAGLGAGALLGAGAARTNSSSATNSNRAASSTPTQMAGSGSDTRPLSALSNSTTTDGRGTTVPAVRDQYSGLDIQPNDEVIAIYPYSATLTDEMNLDVDDVISVVRLYDDGWALGRRTAGIAAEGAFPLVCVTHAQAVDGPASRGMGGSMPGASSDDGGLTSGGEGGISDSVDGAVTADEGALTADEDFEPSRRR
ncbi:hypothetical protein A4X13_0g4988, partial [Tilletia indica]